MLPMGRQVFSCLLDRKAPAITHNSDLGGETSSLQTFPPQDFSYYYLTMTLIVSIRLKSAYCL